MKRKSNETIAIIYKHRHLLTRQEFKTLRGQALAGNGAAALKGLDRIITRRAVGMR